MKYLIISIVVISLIGTISHFLYDITNHNRIIGLFVSVNESTWEHIKIALTPTFLWTIIDYFLYGNNPNYFIAKFISLFVIIILMPLLYYGYKKLLKKDYAIINIIIFYIVIIVSQFIFYYIINLDKLSFIYNYISYFGIFIIFGGYMIHTLMPGKNIIFKDPNTKKYGFKGH